MNFRFPRLTAATTPDTTATFYDNYAPSLQSGEYQLRVTQQVQSDSAAVAGDLQQTPLAYNLLVRGPRFTLDPADIHQQFPASNSVGEFANFLPMLVLNKRSLPWERRLNLAVATNLLVPATTTPSPYPWMALVVFTAEELGLAASNSQQNLTGAQTTLVSALVAGDPANHVVGPNLTAEDGEDFSTMYCKVINVPATSFNQLLPTLDDARYLAHARQVATDAKVPLNLVHDGWFGNVVANRTTLVPSQASDPPLRNIVHLVSLEGYEEYLSYDSATQLPVGLPAGTVSAGMVSLCSWTFQCAPTPGEDFEQLMQNLATGSNTGLLQLPVPAPPTNPTPAQTEAASRLAGGYAPLSYATWSGEQTFAWYRGPFTPVPITPFLQPPGPTAAPSPLTPQMSAQAMVYNPITGLFDQSYAVALQTGRSLALASKPFSTSLLQWRRDAYALVDLLQEYLSSPLLLPQFYKDGIVDAAGNLTATGIADLAALLDQNLVPASFQDVLTTDLYDAIAATIGQAGGFVAGDVTQTLSLVTAAPPTPVADLQSLMQNPDVGLLLSHLSGLDALGKTGASLNPADTTLTLAGGLTEALNSGSVITVTSPDGTATTVLRVAEAVASGTTSVPVQAYAGTATLPAGSTMQLGDGQLMPAQLVQWLAQTALLYGVPFNNLVANSRMLPPESLRFFYLDPNWIDALLDGALSIGLQSSRDTVFQQLLHDKLHQAVDAVLLDVRDALCGGTTSGIQPADSQQVGLLLRSVAVAAWPGLEVRGYANSQLLKPLRLDRVAPDILLVIFPALPDTVDIREPSEGIVFGFLDEGLELRYLPETLTSGQVLGSPTGTTLSLATLAQAQRTVGTNPAYNVAAGLVPLLNTQLSISNLSPASLAVQLVRVPEQLHLTPAALFSH